MSNPNKFNSVSVAEAELAISSTIEVLAKKETKKLGLIKSR